jgi:hypothetical protein
MSWELPDKDRDEDLLPAATATAAPPAQRTRVSLELPDLSFNEWRRVGEQLELQHDASLWWIADWAAYGERQYRRDYGPALEQLYERKSLRNLAYVARNVDTERRRESLSFSHHAEVAPLDPDWQTVWLDDAETHGWSKQELRERLAEWRGNGRSGPTPALTIRAVAELHDLCVAAAQRVGLDPSEWARQTLEHAARLALANT